MALSGYRVMWMLVMFDLPVSDKKQRRAATKFRNFLLDQGFQMAQFSVYMRFCAGKEQVESYARAIQANLPSSGFVDILSFTDRQYRNMMHFTGRDGPQQRESPEQYVMF